MPGIIPTEELVFLLETVALVNDLSDWLGNFAFKSKDFLNVRLVFTADIELIKVLGVLGILPLVFVVDLPDQFIGELGSFFIHYLVLLSQIWHLSFRVSTLFRGISWWQREQFLLRIQKRRLRVRKMLKPVRIKINI
jgi:hypothetical protein